MDINGLAHTVWNVSITSYVTFPHKASRLRGGPEIKAGETS